MATHGQLNRHGGEGVTAEAVMAPPSNETALVCKAVSEGNRKRRKKITDMRYT